MPRKQKLEKEKEWPKVLFSLFKCRARKTQSPPAHCGKLFSLCSNGNRNIDIIAISHVVPVFFKTFQATMQNAKFACRAFHTHRLHHAAAFFSPIPWLFIDMLAPQTLRAMISVPGAFHFCAAFSADEILCSPLKTHTKIRVRPSPGRRLNIQERHFRYQRSDSRLMCAP